MIAPMTKYSFILLSGEQGPFLEKLQELGLVDITRSVKPVDEKSLKQLEEIELLDGLIRGLRRTEIPDGTEGEGSEKDIVELAGSLLMRYNALKEDLLRLNKELGNLRIWGSFDADIVEKLSEAGVPLHFHILPRKQFKESWAEEYAMRLVAEQKGKCYFAVAGEDSLPGEILPPEVSVAEKEKELAGKEEEFAHIMSLIAGAKERIPELEEKRRTIQAELELHLADAAAVRMAEEKVLTLVGYSPAENDAAVTAALDEYGVFYIKEEARVEDNPPISFRNNRFVRMFEPLTDMYGRPGYDGFDPTPFIAVFFLLFFAFCMGDAGYGLVLIIVGLFLRKVSSFKDMAPLVVTLGVGTTVIGFLFHTFFSLDISEWAVFAPVKGVFLPSMIGGYDGTMVLSLAVGIVHICLALIVKTVQATKTKGFLGSLGTWGWTLLIVGGVAVGAFALAGVMDKEVTKWTIIVLGSVSAVGIFLLNDLHRNPLLNIGSGLWETYNTVTGLLGDVLSYLRLYALGLAGCMLGKSFNDIGLLILGDGSGIASWIFFILVVLVGHTLNVAMAALGAFVHPLRLNFLEFFKNSGYEATGRPFKALKK